MIIDTPHGAGTVKKAGARRPARLSGGAPAFGRYCYLFPDLANDQSCSLFPGEPSATFDLLETISKNYPDSSRSVAHSSLPAVYTYFGQFISHDTTAPDGSLKAELEVFASMRSIGDGAGGKDLKHADRPRSVGTIINAFFNRHATPLDLDSLYRDVPWPTVEPGSRRRKKFHRLGSVYDSACQCSVFQQDLHLAKP